ncbi:hypothetical protein A1OE_1288 [Candidatus Endolissoclinum faulkneri L2]|uniref:Uncharacterized protein n=1 Tax=Candidatus Endolissoclinum faulkneri L2 TaxID=1193729 RepID=K7ZDF0_9PROT|nr:hypothetical protein A1OE_1288 [Candidatus Endolissoclinum faulkneri L2]
MIFNFALIFQMYFTYHFGVKIKKYLLRNIFYLVKSKI